MQRELAEVALDSEEKDLKWQEVKLKAEVAKWNGYKEIVFQWQCRTELAKHANITYFFRNICDWIVAQLDMQLPCSEITHESALGYILQSCVQAWAETVGVPTSIVCVSSLLGGLHNSCVTNSTAVLRPHCRI